jgi:DinB family protein
VEVEDRGEVSDSGAGRPPDAAALLTAARDELARVPDALDRLLGGLDAAAWRARPAPKEWAPVEILCHLRDEETEDFGARVRVVVEGGTEFVPIDPERWAVERRYHEADGPAVLADFRSRRAASLAFLAGVAPARLTATVTRPRAGALSGLDVLAAWVAHDRLHLAQLGSTLARVWTDRWASLRCDYAGPIPYAPEPPRPG